MRKARAYPDFVLFWFWSLKAVNQNPKNIFQKNNFRKTPIPAQEQEIRRAPTPRAVILSGVSVWAELCFKTSLNNSAE